MSPAPQATTDPQINIDTYTNCVLDHINKCVDRVTIYKEIKTFPNQKPWMNVEVHLMLKARDATLRYEDQESYYLAKANPRREISQAKQNYKQS